MVFIVVLIAVFWAIGTVINAIFPKKPYVVNIETLVSREEVFDVTIGKKEWSEMSLIEQSNYWKDK